MKMIRIMRGNTAANEQMLAPSGVLTMDTQRRELRFHDGEKKGGWTLVRDAPHDGRLYLRQDGEWKEQKLPTAQDFQTNYAIVERRSLAGQAHTFQLKLPQYTFALNAFALKERAQLAAQNNVLDNFLNNVEFYQSTPAVKGQGVLTVGLGGYYEPTLPTGSSLPVTPNVLLEPSPTRYTRYDRNLANLDTYTANLLYYLVEMQTGAAGATTVTATSSNGSRPPWKAFNRTTQDSDDAWISSATPSSNSPQILQVQLNQGRALNRYVLVNRNNNNPLSPRSWTLQASNNGSDWTVLHTVNDSTNNNAQSARSYTLPNRTFYLYYRLVITARNTTGSVLGIGDSAVAVGRLDLLAEQFDDRILIRSGSTFYTSVNGVLSPVTAPSTTADVTNRGFTDSGQINIAQLQPLQPYQLVTSRDNMYVVQRHYPTPQLARQKTPFVVAGWTRLNGITATTQGAVTALVSRDGTNWFTLSQGKWSNVGTLSDNQAGAEKVMAQGITPTVLNTITAAQWGSFYNDVFDYLYFAWAFNVPVVADNVYRTAPQLSGLVANVDLASTWVKQDNVQVEIEWGNALIRFRPEDAGLYKFAWQENS